MRVLQANPKSESGSSCREEGKQLHDVETTFASASRVLLANQPQLIKGALDRAIENGVFHFLENPPVLEAVDRTVTKIHQQNQ